MSRGAWNTLVGEDDQRRWIDELPKGKQRVEFLKCKARPWYFVDQYCQIYDKVAAKWIPFELWRMQYWVLRDFHLYPQNLALKARQEGLSWLALSYNALYKMVFQPIAKIGVFSKRDDEAVYMLGEERLRGMYNRLPPFLQARRVTKADGHAFGLSNGSVARAFPTTGGDAYAMTDVVLDEFDLVPDQNALMRAVKPTIDGGGSMTIVSRADKDRPQTQFKKLYRGASTKLVIDRDSTGVLRFTRTEREDGNGWNAVFIPWYAHPGRTQEWYEGEKREIEDRTGSLDDLHEQYPETPEEALRAPTMSKRMAHKWLIKCYEKETPLEDVPGAPSVPQLRVYRPPVPGGRYCVGCDPAEGNPTSDPTSLHVIDRGTGEECALLTGQFEPSMAGFYCDLLGKWYNNAPVMIERNNHGHAVLLWMSEYSKLKVLPGDDRKPGWLSSSRGKALLYSRGADAFHDGWAVVHSESTYTQLASIEGSTLRAPEAQHDDEATSFLLALLIRKRKMGRKKARSFQG